MYIEQHIVAPALNPGATHRTSSKPWTNVFHAIRAYRLHPPTRAAFDAVFGLGWEDDTTRLSKPAVHPAQETEVVMNEADTERLWYKQVSSAVMPAFTGPDYFLVERSHSGPLGSTSSPVTVDVQYLKPNTDIALAVGELKAPGTIYEDEWRAGGEKSNDTLRLMKELRGYAYNYKCPQMFCYDGVHMLIILFRARNFEDIQICDPDVFLIPNIAGPGGIHIRYALYRLITNGLHRTMASTAPPVVTGAYTRDFDWFNGNPYWTAAGSRYDIIGGVVRTVMQVGPGQGKRWAWTYNGVFIGWCAAFY